MNGLRRDLEPLVADYPVDVAALADDLLDRRDCTALDRLVPGPGLGLVQFGSWEEEEHHPGPLYLDLDPRRLRDGSLDLVFAQAHFGPVKDMGATLSAWQVAGGSASHCAALTRLWLSGHRSAAVAVQLAAYHSNIDGDDLLEGYSSDTVRTLLQEALAADPYSAVVHYQRYGRFGGSYKEPAAAQLALPLLSCHAWGRGAATSKSIQLMLRLTASFQPELFGDLAGLAEDFTLDARRAAVDSFADSQPELALRLAVDWAYDIRRTDEELESLLRPLAARSSEPIWSRLCEFNAQGRAASATAVIRRVALATER